MAVLVVFTPVGGSYSATLEGQTYTASGGFTVNVSAGTHQMTGSFRGAGFGIGFSTLGNGGVQSGSLRSITGPSVQIDNCSATYFNLDTPNTQRSFQLQFQVTGNVRSACQGD